MSKQNPSRFKDAPNDSRCEYTITLKDKSLAQCGRLRKINGYCKQHAKIRAHVAHMSWLGLIPKK